MSPLFLIVTLGVLSFCLGFLIAARIWKRIADEALAAGFRAHDLAGEVIKRWEKLLRVNGFRQDKDDPNLWHAPDEGAKP